MTKKRIFRCFISFLVICCILFNVASIPARAEVVTITSGIIALLFSIGMGIVAVDLTWDLINGYERSMYDSAIDYYAAEAEKRQEFIDWFDNLKTDVQDGVIDLTNTVREAIRHWGAGILNDGSISLEVESENLSFNGVTLPALPSHDYGYCVLYFIPNFYYLCYYSSAPLVIARTSTEVLYTSKQTTVHTFQLDLGSTTWQDKGSHSYATGKTVSNPAENIFWSNYDLFYNGSTNLWLGATDPSTSVILDVPVSTVGDIAGKIQSGEADEDQIYVPERLDVTQILTGEVDDLDAVNDISTQLAAGTLTYEQYLEMTQVKDDTDVGTDVWVPPSDPGAFALDLTQYFPFCIPFDLYAFFACLNADPVTPVIHWELAVPGGSSLPIDLDLSPFDGVAKLLRTLQLLLFCVGLAFKTRDLIKG